MPYRKRYAKKKLPKTKRVQNRVKEMVGEKPSIVDSIANGVGQVAKLAGVVAPIIAAINTEHKYADTASSVNAYIPGTNDVIAFLTDTIDQGVGDVDRIGNSILAQDIQLRMAINFTSTVGPPPVQGLHCRAMMVVWKQNQQDNPISIAKIFETPTNLYSGVNKDYSDQFVILKDKFFTLNASTSNYGTQGFTQMKWFKKLGFHLKYDGPASTDHTLNHIFLILRSSATAIGNSMQVTYYSRLNFTDN